ncbi:Tenascin-R,Angiopoietin-related protein 1,Ficolin-1-A,Angiopoietin-1,Fibrinogen C domain-containing protein 1,Fibroleukin,Fibrinogen-like protein 1,Ficolin-2,Ficolin-1,Fibrinogen-like protein A,Ficolin-1-B,Angiopoietin-related protein 2,Angiopoietin-4 [Mytilus edulis]|uniref:Fibrinogen C-terminal domain-containing protein n=1 Tax=Mytilus edulis TaxID=6550 RepID=A0A8S3UWS1_MYTED|nr:Tenascin-R,Angiopoietin-related protein 1,Ficolin-1-A,Angiopoietin-1,Fibrinogen C domain-containing protein 1,Fibroleukin,Fibrinogen-like protein 1,Ficolin-2,Ficolin-1,Fibrinogen-like protein A,Ficolin-1-B,Angiopoietin-related protein 2,Angiopoietin-4 [Mytilus edulis]
MLYITTIAAIFALFMHFIASFALQSQTFNKQTDTRIVSSGASMVTTKVEFGFECAIMCTNDNSCCSSSFDKYLKQCQLSCLCNPTMEHHNGSFTFIKTLKSVFSIPKRDCSEVPRGSKSGVYCIQPDNGTEISVFCEMDIDNGGWTTIQRRYDGTVDFYRYWEDYKSGFGDIDGEHWLGNDNLHFILRQGSYRVRFDLEDFTGDTSYAIYDTIYVGDESTNYTLSITGYNGIAGHAMKDWHPNELDGMMFTTRDRDNDISPTNCGFKKQSGWWYAACSYSNINGGYGELYDTIANIYWKTWKPNALKKTRMMIKPN